jgi:hypothetical protein
VVEMVVCPMCNTDWDFSVKFCGECGYNFKVQSSIPKPTGGICKACKSRNLVFNDDGTGRCIDCNRKFVWSKKGEKRKQVNCPLCKKPATFIKDYSRWYCYNCKKYVPKSMEVEKEVKPVVPEKVEEKEKSEDEILEEKFRALEETIEKLEDERETLLKELTVQKRTVERAKERLDDGEITKRTYEYIKKKRDKIIVELDEKLAAIDEKLEDAKIELEVKEEVELGVEEEEEKEK